MDVRRRRQAIRQWLDSRPRQPRQAATRESTIRSFELPDLDVVAYRRRCLPHWELSGSTYFVTFNVARRSERPFSLITAPSGEERIPPAAQLLEESILFGFGLQHDLDAYVIMPDHVHLLITSHFGWTLGRVLHAMKGISSLDINRALERRGPVWQAESFDHLVRGESDWLDKREYLHQNPVAAGLATTPGVYPLSSAVTLDSPGRREHLARLLMYPHAGRP